MGNISLEDILVMFAQELENIKYKKDKIRLIRKYNILLHKTILEIFDDAIGIEQDK